MWRWGFGGRLEEGGGSHYVVWLMVFVLELWTWTTWVQGWSLHGLHSMALGGGAGIIEASKDWGSQWPRQGTAAIQVAKKMIEAVLSAWQYPVFWPAHGAGAVPLLPVHLCDLRLPAILGIPRIESLFVFFLLPMPSENRHVY